MSTIKNLVSISLIAISLTACYGDNSSTDQQHPQDYNYKKLYQPKDICCYLTYEEQQQIIEQTYQIALIAEDTFDISLRHFEVKFSLPASLNIAGRAWHTMDLIEYNPSVFNQLTDIQVQDVIVHEIAHFVTYAMDGFDVGHGEAYINNYKILKYAVEKIGE